ncbi:MAG: hypothetical protein H7287_03935 [Thermoleophilia bacterium]|nr:hypothetical protein [Thermoleophilia bacterium]
MTSTSYGSPSAFAGLVDETRQGSAGGQTLIGVAGIVLAVLLVVGQVSLATTKGMAAHLHNSVQHMTEGNDVMEGVIAKAAPSVKMEQTLAQQEQTLGNVRDTMVTTNTQLGEIGATTKKLGAATSRMQVSSSKLAADVAAVDVNTASINASLSTLPIASDATLTSITKINTDMTALNFELATISQKLMKYGLPRAKGARRT